MKSIIKYIINKLESTLLFIRHIKGKYNCPVCDKSISSFDPIPADFLQKWQEYKFKYNPLNFETLNIANYSCPFCGASDRDRLYAIYIDEYSKNTPKEKKLKFLDIAPVPSLSKWLKEKKEIDYRSADLHNPAADDKVDIMDMNIFEDETFDFILCSHVLEHVTDDIKAMKELYRVLKTGGKGVLMAPIHLDLKNTVEDPDCEEEEENWKQFGKDDHIRLYSKGDFISRLTSAGFRVVEKTSEWFAENTFYHAGIRQESVLYIVEKK